MARFEAKYFPQIPAIYNTWHGMIRRCYDEKHVHYKYYVGKGVQVCEEWRSDYQNFLDWSLANGWMYGLQLDKDINGCGLEYSPDKCKWVSRVDNIHARSNTIQPFAVYDNEGKELHRFYSVKEAILVIGGCAASYSLVLSGKTKSLFKLKFKYLKDVEKDNQEGLELS